MTSRLRVSAEDFPSPTAVAVPWPDAGVVFFIDVCRSQFELSAPSVWMLHQPSISDHQSPTPLSTLPVSPSSISFRCSSFTPKIVNNVLLLFLGDCYAPHQTTSASNANNNAATTATGSSPSTQQFRHGNQQQLLTPFFGVCASLLPPAELVREHNIDAFASFSFAWLCGPEVTSMRPHPRVSFAVAVTEHSTQQQQRPSSSRKQPTLLPNVSVWVHGGIPVVPNTAGSSGSAKLRLAGGGASAANKSFYEPLNLYPDQKSDSDVFLLSGDDKHLRKAVSDDFYGMYELKLSITPVTVDSFNNSHSSNQRPTTTDEGNVSVWPWTRHPGLPLVCHHSLSAVSVARFPLYGNNTNQDQSSKKPYLIVFGGLRLNFWKSLRPDLLPPFRNTEFNISNTFYVYDIEEENWEWKDALIGSLDNNNTSDSAVAKAMMMATADEQQNNNGESFSSASISLVGARPPPVFDHQLVDLTSSANQFLVCGGLRGRFTEKSKEIWAFGIDTENERVLRCSQQTGPQQTASSSSTTTANNNSNNNSSSAATTSSSQHGELPPHIFCLENGHLFAVELKKKRMWHRQQYQSQETGIQQQHSPTTRLFGSAGGGGPWEGPLPIVSAREFLADAGNNNNGNNNRIGRGRSIDLENPQPTVVHISSAQQQGNKSKSRDRHLGQPPNHNNQDGSPNPEYPQQDADNQPQQQQHNQVAAAATTDHHSPRTNAFMMDAFEFGD